MQISFRWTDGNDRDFRCFYRKTEEYYNQLVGGPANREAFVPYNSSVNITGVLIAYDGSVAVGCAGLKRYSANNAEVKRVWVEPEYRKHHIALEMMRLLEKRAKENQFNRLILQTRESMTGAVLLYEKLGYCRIQNYPPYGSMDDAVCFAKDIK